MYACVFVVLVCVRQEIDALFLAWVTKMSVNTHCHQKCFIMVDIHCMLMYCINV